MFLRIRSTKYVFKTINQTIINCRLTIKMPCYENKNLEKIVDVTNARVE